MHGGCHFLTWTRTASLLWLRFAFHSLQNEDSSNSWADLWFELPIASVKCLFIPGIHEVCCCWYYCSLRANVQRHRCEGSGRVRVSVEKWKKWRNKRREMDECRCRERSAGKAVHGNIITVVSTYTYQIPIHRHGSICTSNSWSLYSAAVASSPLQLPLSLPLANTTWTVQGSLQWHHFLLCHRLPSTAWLSPSAFVQHHPALMSTELQHGHTES